MGADGAGCQCEGAGEGAALGGPIFRFAESGRPGIYGGTGAV